MKKMNFLLFGLSLVTTTALANLNVIADIGGDDASLYFEGINRQGDAVAPPAMPQAPASADEAEVAVLPVTTPELTPGDAG